MNRVFFDSSALFAAAYSATGAARDLLKLAIQQQVQIVISQDVLTETERNLERKAPTKLDVFKQLLTLIEPEIVDSPAKETVWEIEQYVAQKDAPIIAAAIAAQPDYLVTYDRKDLLDKPEVAEKSGLQIVTPDVVVKYLSEQEPDENAN
jgi:putative PIN family toxin of toxin-antitoxin system